MLGMNGEHLTKIFTFLSTGLAFININTPTMVMMVADIVAN